MEEGVSDGTRMSPPKRPHYRPRRMIRVGTVVVDAVRYGQPVSGSGSNHYTEKGGGYPPNRPTQWINRHFETGFPD